MLISNFHHVHPEIWRQENGDCLLSFHTKKGKTPPPFQNGSSHKTTFSKWPLQCVVKMLSVKLEAFRLIKKEAWFKTVKGQLTSIFSWSFLAGVVQRGLDASWGAVEVGHGFAAHFTHHLKQRQTDVSKDKLWATRIPSSHIPISLR